MAIPVPCTNPFGWSWAGLAMVHTLTKPIGSPPAFVFYMGTQFSHLDYRVGMIGGKWGFRQMGLTPLREG